LPALQSASMAPSFVLTASVGLSPLDLVSFLLVAVTATDASDIF